MKEAHNFPVSVHLLIYNGAIWLPWCLESLANQTYQDFFLLIIDNGSIDNSYDICDKFLQQHKYLATRTRLVKNKHNNGFARGHNQALSWTASEFVAVLNQDTYLMPDYIEELVYCLKNEERAAAVTGKILSWDFDPLNWHISQLKTHNRNYIDSAGLRISRSRQVVNIGQGELDTKQYDRQKKIFGVSATVPLYRRSALEYVSPDGQIFDEDFFSYKEDVDIAWRLQLAGYDSWIIPSAIALHDRSLAASKGWRDEYKKRRQRARDLKVYSWVNHLGVIIKNDGIINMIRDLPWFVSYELSKMLYLLITDPITLFRGKIRLAKLIFRFIKKRHLLVTTHRRTYKDFRHWLLGEDK